MDILIPTSGVVRSCAVAARKSSRAQEVVPRADIVDEVADPEDGHPHKDEQEQSAERQEHRAVVPFAHKRRLRVGDALSPVVPHPGEALRPDRHIAPSARGHLSRGRTLPHLRKRLLAHVASVVRILPELQCDLAVFGPYPVPLRLLYLRDPVDEEVHAERADHGRGQAQRGDAAQQLPVQRAHIRAPSAPSRARTARRGRSCGIRRRIRPRAGSPRSGGTCAAPD